MALTQRKHFFADLTQESVVNFVTDGGAAVGAVTDNQVNTYRLNRQGHIIRTTNVAQNDAKIFVAGATGWLIPCDNNNDDGIEINPGAGLTAAMGEPLQFTVGTDPAFFLRVVIDVGTITADDYDVLAVGFRKQAAHAHIAAAADLLTAYEDVAGLAIVDANGTINSFTRLAAGVGTATTATHATNTADRFLCFEVNVSATGLVSYRVETLATTPALALSGLAADTLLDAATAFTLTSAAVMIPFIYLVSNGGGATPTAKITRIECGLQ